MKKLYQIDGNGFYLYDVLLDDDENIPSDCIETELPDGLFKPQYINGTWQNGISEDDINAVLGITLDSVKQAKINELSAINNANITFTSNTLGTVHTYLADDSAMAKFNAEYAFVNSDAYDNSPILWYTVEEGGVEHTKEQFNQVWLEGRTFVVTNFAKWDELVKKVKAINTDNQTISQAIAEVQSIVW
ncbi:MAG: hypothetical protein Q8880_13720 [Bacteroidota bacterium]|nr:hypothetical protein [Bacteroidota bacterium]